MKSLVLVEHEGQAARALEMLRAEPGEVRLLALSPGVMRAFEEAGASYAVPEDHCDPSGSSRRGLENYALLEECGRKIDALLPSLPEGLRLNPVYLHYYRVKILIDSIGLRVMELAAVFRGEAPQRIVILAYADDPLWADASELQLLTIDGPVYAAVAPLVAAALSIPARVETLSGGPGRAGSGPLKAAKSLAGALLWLSRRAAGAFSSASRPVLWQIGDRAHDVPELLPPLSRAFRVISWGNVLHSPIGSLAALLFAPGASKSDRDALSRFWAGSRLVFSASPLLRYAGIDCLPLLSPVFKRLFTEEQACSARLYAALRRLVRHDRPRAALTVNTPFTANVLAAWALRAEGVPVVYVQEGGLYGYCEAPMHHYCELSWGDYFLSYGRGCADYLNATRLTPRQKAQALPVGAFRLRRLAASAPDERGAKNGTVMYIASNFHHNVRYAPLCYGEREYYRLRRAVLEALLEAPGVRIIYKAVPRSLERDQLNAFIVSHGDRIEAVDAPLSSVLGRADSFVLDWPTTTLLELLTTRKPIHVLLDAETARPIPGALPALRRRVRAHLDLASLTRELSKPAAAAAAAESLDDAVFLEAYGTGGSDAWNEEKLVSFFQSLKAPDHHL